MRLEIAVQNVGAGALEGVLLRWLDHRIGALGGIDAAAPSIAETHHRASSARLKIRSERLQEWASTSLTGKTRGMKKCQLMSGQS